MKVECQFLPARFESVRFLSLGGKKDTDQETTSEERES